MTVPLPEPEAGETLTQLAAELAVHVAPLRNAVMPMLVAVPLASTVQ